MPHNLTFNTGRSITAPEKLKGLLTGRLKLNPEKESRLVSHLSLVLAGPLNNEAVGTALIDVMNEASYLAVAGNPDEFFQKVLGLNPGEGARLMDIYRAGRWADVDQLGFIIPSIVDEGRASESTDQPAPSPSDSKAVSSSKPSPVPSQHEQSKTVFSNRGSEKQTKNSAGTKDRKSAGVSHQPSKKSETVVNIEKCSAIGSNAESNRPAKPVSCDTPVAPVEMSLSEIKIENAFQCRAKMNEEQIAEYSEKMATGASFPPIEVFRIGDLLAVTDGLHRLKAAKQLGREKILCFVRNGTREQAIEAAVSANSEHGLHRTNEDKRRAVTLALETFPGKSNYTLAELCRVSHTFVRNVREQLETVSSCEPRVGRDGKTRRIPKKRLPPVKQCEKAEDLNSVTRDLRVVDIDAEDRPPYPSGWLELSTTSSNGIEGIQSGTGPIHPVVQILQKVKNLVTRESPFFSQAEKEKLSDGLRRIGLELCGRLAASAKSAS